MRVIGRTSATEMLTGIKGGGALEKYIAVRALEPFINKDLMLERMVALPITSAGRFSPLGPFMFSGCTTISGCGCGCPPSSAAALVRRP